MVTEDEFKAFPEGEWEVTRTEEKEGEKRLFIIPAAGTEFRKLLHEHASGYREKIEKEISKNMKKNIFIDNSKTGDLQDRRTARQENCKTGIAEENSEFRLPSATNSILLNSGLSATNTHLLSTEAEDTFMERGCTVESSYRRFCNGIFGVPITFLDKYNSEQFEIVGATESEGKGFSNGLWFAESGIAQPLINKQRKYKRLFARKIL